MGNDLTSQQAAIAAELQLSDVLGLTRDPAFDATRLRGDELVLVAKASKMRMLAAGSGGVLAAVLAEVLGMVITTKT